MTRETKIIQEYIDRLELDLSGLTILTEEATGHYQWSPVIARMAGAKKVITIGEHGNGKYNLQDKIDIFLNLGHVRPIDKKLLRHAADKAVVAYMCESWEWREGDVDKYACRRMGIPIVGVNENFGDFNIFESCGQLLLKMLFDVGHEVVGGKYIVIGYGYFGEIANRTLLDNNAETYSSFTIEEVPERILRWADTIVLADYEGKDSSLLLLVGIDPDIITFVWNHRMPKTLAYLGARPVIGLHCLGMKAAEVVYRGEQDGKYKNLVQVII